MKRSILAVICVICVLFSASCTDLTVIDNGRDNSACSDRISLPPLDCEAVAWMTMTGGLGGITTKVMFKGNNDSVIRKVVDIINENPEALPIDKTAAESFLPRIRPIGLVISLEDGTCMHLWPSYEGGRYIDGHTVTMLSDQFILQRDENGGTAFYTIFSSRGAKYLKDGWKEDMPIVDDISIRSGSSVLNDSALLLHEGDPIIVSGDGCTNSTVNIYIRKNGDGKPYHIGLAETELGVWKWDGQVKSNITTLDGEPVKLEDGLYDIVVILGEREKAVCGIIRLGSADKK